MSGRARVGALAQTDRAHLRKRTNRLRNPLADRDDAGDERGADGPEADEHDSEFPRGWGDFSWLFHGPELYHERLAGEAREAAGPASGVELE